MKIRQNLHIHSQHSCDSACATIADIQKEMVKCGMIEFGLSDHLHTNYNLCDIQGAKNDFLCAQRPKEFHFGIEVSSVSTWECEQIAQGNYQRIYDDPVYGLRFAQGPAGGPTCIGITQEDIDNLGIEYVIGGVHWPNYTASGRESAWEDYFNQQMALIENPLVTILAHPWDSIEMAAGNWYMHRDVDHIDYGAISNIPQHYNDKLCQALLKYNKPAELNLAVICSFRLPEECRKFYWNTFAQWREAGVKFTIGTDQHSAHNYEPLLGAAELLLDAYGFKDDDIKYLFN
jgi:histidinol phosphatase-like PHP family hydrolase